MARSLQLGHYSRCSPRGALRWRLWPATWETAWGLSRCTAGVGVDVILLMIFTFVFAKAFQVQLPQPSFASRSDMLRLIHATGSSFSPGGALARRAAHRRLSAVGPGRPWGVVMDIDGVVVRGKSLIPGSAEAIKMLREACVPYAFMTNGGGVLEAVKARQLAKLLDDPTIDESRILLSHTPMRALAERYRCRRVVVVGSMDTPQVAQAYGFDVEGQWAVTPQQIAAGTKGIDPRVYGRDVGLPPVNVNADGEPPIEAVLIFYDPVEWSLELQVLTDVLSGGHPLGTGGADTASATQAVEVFASNPDFLWQAAYPAPRYGQGAFVECLRALWLRLSGHELRVKEFGKPHASQFEAARGLVQAQVAGAELKRIYMIGDNPAADIRGANDAPDDVWRSVLVCTGVYRGGVGGNDPADPAWRVESDLKSAVERLLATADGSHV